MLLDNRLVTNFKCKHIFFVSSRSFNREGLIRSNGEFRYLHLLPIIVGLYTNRNTMNDYLNMIASGM